MSRTTEHHTTAPLTQAELFAFVRALTIAGALARVPRMERGQ